ncbi:MAG: homoserine dehydrogenase [Candidatus Dormibacteria bacterium]
MSTEPPVLGIGLLGAGTVGGALAARLAQSPGLVTRRSRAHLRVVRCAVRDQERGRPGIPPEALTTDPAQVVDDPAVEVVVELMGGEDPSYRLIERALAAGKHVVTANKLVVARHGAELATLARARGSGFLFEAAVGGGIPVLGALATGLAGVQVEALQGVMNSTTNYILSRMADAGLEMDAAIAEAQAAGYAEADPSSDVDGHDAVFKLAILASLAFGQRVDPDAIEREGIGGVRRADLELARSHGYGIKLVGAATLHPEGVAAWVRPALVPGGHPLAAARDAINVFAFQGDLMRQLVIRGMGAGGPATASAVLSDLAQLSRSIAEGRPALTDLEEAPADLCPARHEYRHIPGLERYPVLTEHAD